MSGKIFVLVFVCGCLSLLGYPSEAEGQDDPFLNGEADEEVDLEEEWELEEEEPGFAEEGEDLEAAEVSEQLADLETKKEPEEDQPTGPDEWRMIDELLNSKDGPPQGEAIADEGGWLVGEHLRQTEAFRASDAHPEWELMRVEDVEVTRLERFKPRAWHNAVEMVYVEYKAEGGLHVQALFEKEAGILRFYRRLDVHKAIVAELEGGRWAPPKLTPAQALERATQLVATLLGGAPDDVAPAAIEFGVPPEEEKREREDWSERLDETLGTWSVFLERHDEVVKYRKREGIGIAFSERFGVVLYADVRFSDLWKGHVLTEEEAVREARQAVRQYLHEKGLERGRTPSVILLGRAIVGGPLLLPADRGNLRRVRPCWLILVPVCVAVDFEDSEELTCDILLDAETGKAVEIRRGLPVGRYYDRYDAPFQREDAFPDEDLIY
jgi:hypothetical protein